MCKLTKRKINVTKYINTHISGRCHEENPYVKTTIKPKKKNKKK